MQGRSVPSSLVASDWKPEPCPHYYTGIGGDFSDLSKNTQVIADFGELYSPNFLFLSHLSILQLVRQTTFIFKRFFFFFSKIPSLMALSTFQFEQILMQNQKPSAGGRVVSSVSSHFSGLPAEIHL